MVNWLLPPTRKYGARTPTTELSVMLAYFSAMILMPAISLAQSSTVAFDQKRSSSLCLKGEFLLNFNIEKFGSKQQDRREIDVNTVRCAVSFFMWLEFVIISCVFQLRISIVIVFIVLLSGVFVHWFLERIYVMKRSMSRIWKTQHKFLKE